MSIDRLIKREFERIFILKLSVLTNLKVQRAGNQLDTVTGTLKDVERCLSVSQLNGEQGEDGASSVDPDSVVDVLVSMTEVKNGYQNLKRDLHEVQVLQKEMAEMLGYQMRSMTHTYNILKRRIELRIPNQPPAMPPPPIQSMNVQPNQNQSNHNHHHHHHHHSHSIGGPTTVSSNSLSSSPPSN